MIVPPGGTRAFFNRMAKCQLHMVLEWWRANNENDLGEVVFVS
jgi:hypothetical protein